MSVPVTASSARPRRSGSASTPTVSARGKARASRVVSEPVPQPRSSRSGRAAVPVPFERPADDVDDDLEAFLPVRAVALLLLVPALQPGACGLAEHVRLFRWRGGECRGVRRTAGWWEGSCSRMTRNASREHRNVPVTIVPSTRFQSSRATSATGTAGRRGSGVVEEQIDPAVPVAGGTEQRRDLVGAGDVGGDGESVTGPGRGEGRGSVQGVGAPSGQDHVPAPAEQGQGGGTAQPASRAGDDCRADHGATHRATHGATASSHRRSRRP